LGIEPKGRGTCAGVVTLAVPNSADHQIDNAGSTVGRTSDAGTRQADRHDPGPAVIDITLTGETQHNVEHPDAAVVRRSFALGRQDGRRFAGAGMDRRARAFGGQRGRDDALPFGGPFRRRVADALGGQPDRGLSIAGMGRLAGALGAQRRGNRARARV
jgi:hypothetical protein